MGQQLLIVHSDSVNVIYVEMGKWTQNLLNLMIVRDIPLQVTLMTRSK